MTQIKHLLKAARKAKKMTQIEVAKNMNLHQSQYSRMEVGLHDLTFGMMERFCGAIGITLSELVASAEPPTSNNPKQDKELQTLHNYKLEMERIPHKKRKSIYALIALIKEELQETT